MQLQEALLPWGLFSCRCTAFPVGRAGLPAGFLPCRTVAEGRGLLFSWCALTFQPAAGPTWPTV